MSYYNYTHDCHQDIIYSLYEKIDKTKINDDDYITTFINNSLITEINSTIYNKLLSFTSEKNQKFIENCKNYYNNISYGYSKRQGESNFLIHFFTLFIYFFLRFKC